MTNGECALVMAMLPASRDCDPERKDTPNKTSVFVTEKRINAMEQKHKALTADIATATKRMARVQLRLSNAST